MVWGEGKKPHPMRVFIDLDGLMYDCINGMRSYFELPLGNPYPETLDDILEAAGCDSKNQLFGCLSTSFWRNLPVIEKGLELYYWCQNEFNTYILSSAVDGTAMLGKYQALESTLGLDYEKLRNLTVFTRHKHFLANDRSLLVDDFAGECERFNEWGGWAIKFRPERFDSIKAQIRQIGKSVLKKHPVKPTAVIDATLAREVSDAPDAIIKPRRK